MTWLALGYFLSYIPYAMLVKALSSGLVPGTGTSVDGFVLLPAAALGQLAAMPVFLGATGWWRYARRRKFLGLHVVAPGRETLAASFFTALIIATTTLNFTFAAVSILFMLLLMRGGVLILSPLVDAARRRQVAWYSWLALILSLAAVVVALGDVGSYHLTGLAMLSVAIYLIGYVGRFEIMSRVAKTSVKAIDRRYFVEEHGGAAVVQVLLLGAAALLGQPGLREGFTSFLATPAALGAVAIGVSYQVLFVFGTLIYLHPREYTWCVPANRCSSLASGLVVSYVLVWLTPLAPPGPAQLLAVVFVCGAVLALSYPALAAWWVGRADAATAHRLLFVCGGNTCRSAMAEAIARTLVGSAGGGRAVLVASAGLTVERPGAPMTAKARSILAELGISHRPHRARPVTPSLAKRSTAIYCMTRAQHGMVIAMAPQVADRIFCLDPAGDIPSPVGQPLEVYRHCAQRIRDLIRARLRELLGPAALSAQSG